MVDYEQVWDALLEKLKADSELSGKIKQWLFGTPVKIPTGFPYIYVQFNGGPREFASVGGRCKDVLRFYVAVIDRHVEEDKAERSVIRLAERIRSVLEADRTLGGLVHDSRLTNKEMGILREREYAIVGFRWTWEGWTIE